MTARPFVLMHYSPKLTGRARQFGGYIGVRIVETTDGARPDAITSHTVLRVVRDWGAVHDGTTERSEGFRARREAAAMVEHLNLVHQVHEGIALISPARVAAELHAERRQELELLAVDHGVE